MQLGVDKIGFSNVSLPIDVYGSFTTFDNSLMRLYRPLLIQQLFSQIFPEDFLWDSNPGNKLAMLKSF